MAATEKMERRIVEFPQTCRQAGLKVTPQRSAIFAMLAATDTHPSPEGVYSAIREVTPSISLATVYKILELFSAKGFIRRVSTLDQVTRYDANVEAHHHLICSQCGGIQDVTLNGAPPEQPAVPDSADFQVSGHEIHFHGLCGACRS